ncbi:hypothetical protein ACFE04_010224 [Oxalis oulophora]
MLVGAPHPGATVSAVEKEYRHEGLRGNRYRLFSGDNKESVRLSIDAISRPIDFTNDIDPRVIPFFHKQLQTYGKNFISWSGPAPRVTIMNPDHLKEIFNKIYDFPKANINPLNKMLLGGFSNYNGDKWAKHRKIISPAFHQEKLKLMQSVLCASCSEIICKWGDLVIANNGQCEIDVWPDLVTLTCDVISRTAFGSNFKEGKRIFQLQDEQQIIVTQVMGSPYIPGMRFLPTKINKRAKKTSKELQEILMGIINKRLNAMKSGQATKDDLLGILLDSNREISQIGNERMSMEDVLEECKLFYFLGHESLSALLVWTMILLSKHKNWQEKAREEIMHIFGNNKPDYDGLNHLKIVTMILNEVLRLYSPVSYLIRTIDKEMQFGDFTLPAGVQLLLPLLLIHRDRDFWGDDALEFKPERFGHGISKATNNQALFLPFGWGPRNCVAQNFALAEAKMAVSMILQRFSIELSSSYVHAPHFFLSVRPQHGAHLILRKL